MKRDWKLILTILALLVSISSILLSYRTSKTASIASMKPVLVFEYDKEKGWYLRNVGNGPALNVLLAIKDDNTDWHDPVRISPLSRNGEFSLFWMRDSNIRTLGASYQDFMQRSYSTTCTDDLSKIYDHNIVKTRPEEEIIPHWKKSKTN